MLVNLYVFWFHVLLNLSRVWCWNTQICVFPIMVVGYIYVDQFHLAVWLSADCKTYSSRSIVVMSTQMAVIQYYQFHLNPWYHLFWMIILTTFMVIVTTGALVLNLFLLRKIPLCCYFLKAKFIALYCSSLSFLQLKLYKSSYDISHNENLMELRVYEKIYLQIFRNNVKTFIHFLCINLKVVQHGKHY